MQKCFLSLSFKCNLSYLLSLFTYGDETTLKHVVSVHLNKRILSWLADALSLRWVHVCFLYIVVGPYPVFCSRVIGMQCFGAVTTIFQVPSYHLPGGKQSGLLISWLRFESIIFQTWCLWTTILTMVVLTSIISFTIKVYMVVMNSFGWVCYS